MRTTYTLYDSDKHIYSYSALNHSEGKCILPSSIYFNILTNANHDLCGIIPYIDFLDDNIITLDYLFFYLSPTESVTAAQDLYNKFSRLIPCYKPYYISGDVDSFDLDLSVANFTIDWDSNIFGIPVIGDVFDDKGLYPELLDNTEQTNEVKAYINNPDPQTLPVWSQDEKNLIDFVENYNKNVLLLRSTRKVNIENTVSTASTSDSSVNLSGVENKLQSINNNLTNLNDKLEIEKTVDDETEIKSITEIIDEKSSDNPIVVSSEDLSPWSPV